MIWQKFIIDSANNDLGFSVVKSKILKVIWLGLIVYLIFQWLLCIILYFIKDRPYARFRCVKSIDAAFKLVS